MRGRRWREIVKTHWKTWSHTESTRKPLALKRKIEQNWYAYCVYAMLAFFLHTCVQVCVVSFYGEMPKNVSNTRHIHKNREDIQVDRDTFTSSALNLATSSNREVISVWTSWTSRHSQLPGLQAILNRAYLHKCFLSFFENKLWFI